MMIQHQHGPGISPMPHKKTRHGPHRVQISLRSTRKKQIPQIKIELDHMLDQAFSEMKVQPRKNLRLGVKDVYVLDNELVREYVEAVYEEYGIQDPLVNDAHQNNQSGNKSRFKKDMQAMAKCQTPNHSTAAKEKVEETSVKKIGSNLRNFTTPTKKTTGSKMNTTSERLSKLKQNFQSELKTLPIVVFEGAVQPQKLSFQEVNSSNQRKPNDPRPLNKHQQSQPRYLRNSTNPNPSHNHQNSNNSLSSKNSSPSPYPSGPASQSSSYQSYNEKYHSYLLKKTKYKYCLMCQYPIQNNHINSHQKQCPQLQQLLNTPHLQTQQILFILEEKIRKVQKQLEMYQRCVHQDGNIIQELIWKISRESDRGGDKDRERERGRERGRGRETDRDGVGDHSYLEDGEEIIMDFSKLNTIKCMEALDRLNWFKKMKAKAQIKRQ